jgi:hypothetical protein
MRPEQMGALPRRTFWGRFTRLGQLRNRWAEALGEPDPFRSLEKLREAREEFGKRPDAFAHLWPAFLQTMLSARFGRLLDKRDFDACAAIGERVAASPSRIPLEHLWRPLVTARDSRGEGHAACALLTRLYRMSPTNPHVLAGTARDLALRGARGDEHMAVYADLLGRAGWRAPPEVIRLVSDTLRVGFDSDRPRIRRAGRLAGLLYGARADVPGRDLALGLHCLLNGADYNRAAWHLNAAVAAAPADPTAFLGLLSAQVRRGDHPAALAALAGRVGRPSSTPIEGMAELCRVLVWLHGAGMSGPPPAGTDRLTALGIETYAGQWLDYAIGRMHLIEGNARRAAASLVPLAAARPDWAYHATWASLLTGDRREIARRAATRARPSWALGCLLMDADPTRVTDAEVELLRRAAPPEYAQIAVARTAMAQAVRPAAEPSWTAGSGSTEEELEALRTVLGVRFAGHRQAAMAAAMALPQFQRLPAAERLLWQGLAELRTDPRAALRPLTEAVALGHPRAALVLVAHELQLGSAGDSAVLLLETLPGPKADLLRAWAAALHGRERDGERPADGEHGFEDREDGPSAAFDRLCAQGMPRAYYALGHIHLGRNDPAAAALAFNAALSAGALAVRDDAQALACASELATTGRSGGRSVAELWPAATGHPWASWILGLAQLSEDPTKADLEMCGRLVDLVETTDPDTSGDQATASVGALAVTLARACTATTDPDRAGALAGLLGQLARRLDHPEVRRSHRFSVALAARLRRAETVDGRAARAVAGTDPGNGLLALVAARFAVDGGETDRAAQRLRVASATASATAAVEGLICGIVADVLEGRRPGPAPAELAPPTDRALRVMRAAGLAEADPARCRELLIEALDGTGPDIADLVDIGRALPIMCGGGGRTSPSALVDLVRRLARSPAERPDPLTLARSATAVGDFETAHRVWPTALGRGDTARAEYARFLCHQARAARKEGDALEAARLLRMAASHLGVEEDK